MKDRTKAPSGLKKTIALTPDDVHVIRASTESTKALAIRFGVSESTIGNIKARRSWQWVEEKKVERR